MSDTTTPVSATPEQDCPRPHAPAIASLAYQEMALALALLVNRRPSKTLTFSKAQRERPFDLDLRGTINPDGSVTYVVSNTEDAEARVPGVVYE